MILNYYDDGPGPVVVLLHGFPLDSSMWTLQASTIGSVYRVIRMDLRGFGKSAAPEGIYTMEAMGEDVIETLDSLQLTEPVVLGGLSMGGYISFALMARYPERFRGLMLVNTKATADPDSAVRSREVLADQVESTGDTGPVAAAMLPNLFSEMTRQRRPQVISAMEEVIKRTPARAVAGALRGMGVRPDRTDVLGKIAVPTLVIGGEDDPITPPDGIREMAAAIPGAECVVIPGAAHLTPLETPQEVNEAMIRFLGRFN